jgi:ADP-heptose:LPS heptosyltransferase
MLLARRLGANGAVPALQLVTPGHADEYIQDYLRREGLLSPLFAVNPFSSKGSTYKRWGLDRYGDLIGRLGMATGARSIILWGPGEEEEARELQRLAGEYAVLACPTTVAQLAALLRKMDMYIGGDTGVMHLAAFSGIPVVALFGPTDRRINGPYGPIHRIVRKDVPCSPCKNKTCPDRQCLSGISVDEVLEAVLNLHKGAGNRQ